MAIAASVTVAITVIGAVTLLPALLATLGLQGAPEIRTGDCLPRSFLPTAPQRQLRHPMAGSSAGGHAGRTALRPVVTGGLALIALVALASPFLSRRLGSADASSDPTGSVTRTYYDTMSSAFGDGWIQSRKALVGGANP